jgi:hypothetical protein
MEVKSIKTSKKFESNSDEEDGLSASDDEAKYLASQVTRCICFASFFLTNQLTSLTLVWLLQRLMSLMLEPETGL